MAQDKVKADILDGIDQMEADAKASGDRVVMYSDGLQVVEITTDQLSWAGELLYGRNWKTEMSEILDLKDAARIREIMRNRRPIPKRVGAKILDTLRSRIEDLAELADEIEEAHTERGETPPYPVEGQGGIK